MYHSAHGQNQNQQAQAKITRYLSKHYILVYWKIQLSIHPYWVNKPKAHENQFKSFKTNLDPTPNNYSTEHTI